MTRSASGIVAMMATIDGGLGSNGCKSMMRTIPNRDPSIAELAKRRSRLAGKGASGSRSGSYGSCGEGANVSTYSRMFLEPYDASSSLASGPVADSAFVDGEHFVQVEA